jgi:hypothetical protein
MPSWLSFLAASGVVATGFALSWTSVSTARLGWTAQRSNEPSDHVRPGDSNDRDRVRLAKVVTILAHAESPPIAPDNDNHAVH